MAELGHGSGFDLSDPFAGGTVDAADLVEGVRPTVGEPEP
jgi:hypothetical protein